MKKIITLSSRIIPLQREDVDTDQIIPAQYLKVTDREGLAKGLFAGWRYFSSGEENPDFPLNRPEYQEAKILLVGKNFGCGSSREHAPWALLQWGLRAVISTSFADIFRSNALKNGLLPVEISPSSHKTLFKLIADDPSAAARIDLAAQEIVVADKFQTNFPIDSFSKKCLLEGLDPLGYLIKHQPKILEYETKTGKGPASGQYSTRLSAGSQ
jgi:3-isopropylmalate/(R)-2-methylmalate dehydratase small subunit